MPRKPKARRVVARYSVVRIDADEYHAKAYDQGGNRFPEADMLNKDREALRAKARTRVNEAYTPKGV